MEYTKSGSERGKKILKVVLLLVADIAMGIVGLTEMMKYDSYTDTLPAYVNVMVYGSIILLFPIIFFALLRTGKTASQQVFRTASGILVFDRGDSTKNKHYGRSSIEHIYYLIRSVDSIKTTDSKILIQGDVLRIKKYLEGSFSAINENNVNEFFSPESQLAQTYRGTVSIYRIFENEESLLADLNKLIK